MANPPALSRANGCNKVVRRSLVGYAHPNTVLAVINDSSHYSRPPLPNHRLISLYHYSSTSSSQPTDFPPPRFAACAVISRVMLLYYM